MLRVNLPASDFADVRFLGRGGMGEVYSAVQRSLNRPVAVKVLRWDLSDMPEAVDRFQQEVQVLASLDHPNIVRVYSVGKLDDGRLYFVMPLVRGVSLAEILQAPAALQVDTGSSHLPQGTPVGSQERGSAQHWSQVRHELWKRLREEYLSDPPNFAATVGTAAARALAHAHRRHYSHRDIKPSNIMIDEEGQVYLLDFGLTRSIDHDESSIGLIRGTPWYMSPEQARGEPLTPASDIYSLGVTLYEIVAKGQGPYEVPRERTDEVLDHVRQGRIVPLAGRALQAPLGLLRVVERAMAFLPKSRYADAALLACDLDRFRRPAPVPEGTTLVTPGALPQSRRKRIGRMIQVAMGLVSIALLIALGMFFGFAASSSATGSGDEMPAIASDYPPSLLHRKIGERVPLLRPNGEPIWSRRLRGDGGYYPMGNSTLRLVSQPVPPRMRTLIALDSDPLRRPFELALEIKVETADLPDHARGGIFFGYPVSLPPDKSPPRYMSLMYDLPRVVPEQEIFAPHGRFILGTTWDDDGHGPTGRNAWYHLEVDAVRTMRFIFSLDHGDWHHVRITCQKDKLTVGVDQRRELTAEYSLPAIRDYFQGKFRPEVEFFGAVGIWAKKLTLYVRNATIVALP